MACERFPADGMRFLDGEMNPQERLAYEEHVRQCAECARELREMGRIVGFTDELRLKAPDEHFWASYWSGVYRRMERGTGFVLLMIGAIALMLFGVYKVISSPELFTARGLGVAAVIVGLVVLFVSVARERYHEAKSDPYKEVKR